MGATGGSSASAERQSRTKVSLAMQTNTSASEHSTFARRARRAGEWALGVAAVVAFFMALPGMHRLASQVPLWLAATIMGAWLLVAICVDMLQCGELSSISHCVLALIEKGRAIVGVRKRRDVQSVVLHTPAFASRVLTEAESRREAFRSIARANLVAFVISTLLLCGHMKGLGVLRPWFVNRFGEAAFNWTFGIGGFATLLVPYCILLTINARTRPLRCPSCGQYLSDLRSVRRLNREQRCAYCGAAVPITPLTRAQQICDFSFMALGMVSMLVFITAFA